MEINGFPVHKHFFGVPEKRIREIRLATENREQQRESRERRNGRKKEKPASQETVGWLLPLLLSTPVLKALKERRCEEEEVEEGKGEKKGRKKERGGGGL